jgi:hypothetical protein
LDWYVERDLAKRAEANLAEINTSPVEECGLKIAFNPDYKLPDDVKLPPE